MFILYMVCALYILSSNISQVLPAFKSIFTSAFGGMALVGGGTGVVFRDVLITGVRRAVFSNEAGIGTAPMAHGAAKTKEPVREGLVAMLGPFLDTNLICTITALIILITGVPAAEDGVVMTVSAFEKAMPGVGSPVLTLIIVLFSMSSMISYSYYSLKCARYLLGYNVGSKYIYVYIISLLFAAYWTQDLVLNILDTAFALMAIPTVTATLLLSRKVVGATREYYKRMRRSD